MFCLKPSKKMLSMHQSKWNQKLGTGENSQNQMLTAVSMQ